MKERAGFSLVEVLVALVILSVGILGMQVITARYINIVATSDRRAEALQLVRDRLDEIRTDPAYQRLVERYHNQTEEDLDGLAGLRRTTFVERIEERRGEGTIDFTRVMVTVSGSGLAEPVIRSISVGAP
jgi:type IV pilus modification protein PilV